MPSIDLDDLEARLRRPPRPPAELSPRLARSLCVAAVSGYKEGFRSQRAPDGTPWAPLKYPRPRGGSTVLVDTGRLRNSGEARVSGETLALSATAPGAAAHQFGAVVRPKAAKALAIPVTVPATRFASPRRFPGPALVYLPSRHQNPDDRGKLAQITFKGRGKRARVVVTVHYLLRAKVVVPKRPFVGFSADTVRDMADMVATERAKTLTAGLGGS
jgi:phage gpG-like protein